MNSEPAAPGTRERLIAAMRDALRTRGYHGVGLNELLSAAGAPKGVLYHHFPGGKTELAIAAIEAVTVQLTADLDKVMQRSGGNPAEALAGWMGGAQKLLAQSGFERGCPLATVALESTPDDARLRAALAQAFAAFRARLTAVLTRSGVPDTRSRSLAALIVSAYEGALLQARVAGDVQAMQDTAEALIALVRQQLPPSSSVTQDAP